LHRKLGIKEGHRVATLSAPAYFPDLVGPLPEGVSWHTDPEGAGSFDVLVVFVTSPHELEDGFARGRARLDPFGGLWVAWPKQSSPLATDLKEGAIRSHGLSSGLVDNKICAIDADWSGLRFVVRKADRPRRNNR